MNEFYSLDLFSCIKWSCICECQAAKVPVKEYEFDEKKLANVQSHLVCLFYKIKKI